MTKTVDLEHLKQFTKDLTNGEAAIREVVDEYRHYVVVVKSTVLLEASDEEILSLPETTGQFAFLDNPGEDIYTVSDGSPL